MVHARCGETHAVVVHTTASPTDAEWQLYLDDFERWQHSLIGYLIFTSGGAPNSHQRRQLRDQIAAHGRPLIRTAVVSDSLLVRGTVSAINLFYGHIRSFRPDATDAALTHIGGLLHRDAILSSLSELRQRLGSDAR
jgi:hypothetical protein